MSPNPEVISQSPEAEVDKNIFKVVLVGFFGVASAFFAFLLLNLYLVTVTPLYFWLTVLMGVFFLVFTILQVFLVKSRFRLNLIVFLEALAALGVFYARLWPQPAWALDAGALIFFFFLSVAVFRGSASLANSLRINFWPTARVVLEMAVTGMLIFMSIILYMNYFVWGNFNDVMGQGLVDGVLNAANPVLDLQFTNLSFNGTVQDFFTNLATAEAQKMTFNNLEQPAGGLRPNFNSLTPVMKAEIVQQAAASLKATAEKSIGPLNDNDRVNAVVYRLIKNYLHKFSPATFSLLSLIAIVLIFAALKGFVALFYWFIVLIAFILFKFLIIVGFAYLNLETRSREFVMMS